MDMGTQTHMYVHTRTHETCAHRHRDAQTHMHTYGHTDTQAHAHTHAHTDLHKDTQMHTHKCAHAQSHMHMDTCSQDTHGHRHMQKTWTHADTPTHSQAQTHMHRDTTPAHPSHSATLGTPRLLPAQAPLVLSAWGAAMGQSDQATSPAQGKGLREPHLALLRA